MAPSPHEMKRSRFHDLAPRLLSSLLMAPVGYYIVMSHHKVAYGLMALLIFAVIAEWFLISFGKKLRNHSRPATDYDNRPGFRISVSLLTLLTVCAGGAAFIELSVKAAPVITAALVMTVICADTGAYLAGKIFGGRKLCPAISPNKTVAGLIGGLTAGAFGGYCTYAFAGEAARFTPHFPVFFLLALSAQCGDLWESFFKRVFGVKDSGVWFPGHGGFFDRLDGLLFASVTAWLFSAQSNVFSGA